MSGHATQYADLRPLLMNPVLVSSWDRITHPIAWPRQKFTPPEMSGDQGNPALWLELRWDVDDAKYLTARSGQVFVTLDVAFMLEPVTRAGAGDLVERKADELAEIYRQADVADSIYFRTQEARLEWQGDDDGWDRTDWTCPVWYFPGA